jgi:hypothetical protein
MSAQKRWELGKEMTKELNRMGFRAAVPLR